MALDEIVEGENETMDNVEQSTWEENMKRKKYLALALDFLRISICFHILIISLFSWIMLANITPIGELCELAHTKVIKTWESTYEFMSKTAMVIEYKISTKIIEIEIKSDWGNIHPNIVYVKYNDNHEEVLDNPAKYYRQQLFDLYIRDNLDVKLNKNAYMRPLRSVEAAVITISNSYHLVVRTKNPQELIEAFENNGLKELAKHIVIEFEYVVEKMY